MKRYLLLVTIATLVSVVGTELKADTKTDTTRLRVIMTTDLPDLAWTNGGDPDDIQSMVRFLLFSNEFDVEGLVASAGTNSFTADKNRILEVLDYYDLVDENLRIHDPDYPTADYLRSVTFQGMGNEGPINIQWHCDNGHWSNIIGEGRDCEASEAIIAAADKDDPRPIYIGVWGGPRDVAQAIWKVQNTRTTEAFNAFISKLRIFLIHCQDATNQYLMNNFPDLFVVWSRYTYLGMFGVDNRAWVLENLRNNHGPLCAIYPDYNYKGEPDGVVEGDSPSFMWLLSANRGINDPEDPTQPSWGGEYGNIPGTNKYGGPDYEGPKSSISKWADDFQPLFAERADWCLGNEGSESIWLEAECGTVGSLWKIVTDRASSNRKYVTIQPGNNSLDSAPDSSNGQILIPFTVSEGGKYFVWARIKASGTDSDSFWLRMDDGNWYKWNDLKKSVSWTWDMSNNFNMEQGTHTLTFAYCEDGPQLDKLYITNSFNIPTVIGEEAENLCDPTGISNLINIDRDYILAQNYPNPFNPITQIEFTIPEQSFVSLKVYNMHGEEIAELAGEAYQAGMHSIIFNTTGYASGIYYYSLVTQHNSITRKMVVVK